MHLSFEEFKKQYENLNDFKIIEDNDLFYVRKPAWIPSSFWQKESVLDYLEQWKLPINFIKNQISNFDKNEEYGLLNRLDNATSWFLYFAKNKHTYNSFKKLQKENKIQKIYYAKVNWWFNNDNLWLQILNTWELEISYPIMHKNKSKMIVIKSNKDIKKWRWKQHFVKTQIKKLFYDKLKNETYLEVIITRWIRHQIRAHLASIGYPIIGDKLYWGKQADKLYLFSVGIKNFKTNAT